jgi:acyl-CoA synthetase (AMP-forming)/AMP-acid ligase II
MAAVVMRRRRARASVRRARAAASRSRWRVRRARACLDDAIAATLPLVARTTVDLLRDVASAHPERDAYVEPGRRMTYADWDRAADGVASWLRDRGVGAGDVVALSIPSSIEYAVCYQAAMRLRAIATGINPRLGPTEVGHIVAQAEPRVIVREDDLADVRDAFTLAPPSRLPAAKPDDPVAIVWTSGTTGLPKGAVFDHENLAAVAVGAGPLGEPFDRRLSPLPFAHVGYMTRPWEEIEKVITTVIPATPWRAADTLALMARERVTVGQGVPTQWRLMLDAPAFATTDLSALRIAGTGAAVVPPELVREMEERLGCPVVIGYTSTEAAITTGTVPGDEPEVIARTVGRPRVNVEVEVVGDDGATCPAGAVGRVRCRSGAVMRGYWRDPARTAEVLDADGWLHTGDLGSFDDRGYLTLVGRRSEMYIRGGYNVYPAEVERVLSEHPAVAAVAVVGLPDPVLGEIGAAFVVAAAGATPDLPALRAHVAARLADYKAPDRLLLVEALPVTAMGKVDKRALAAPFG